MRAISLQASSKDVDGAISRYLLLRSSEETAQTFINAPTITDAMDEIADPALANIVREAVWFCWEQGRAEYSPTAERRRFMRGYVAGCIPTARLLDEAWAACRAEERDGMRASLIREFGTEGTGSTAPDLDSLDDSDIDRLYHATLRQVAKDSR